MGADGRAMTEQVAEMNSDGTTTCLGTCLYMYVFRSMKFTNNKKIH